MISKPEILILHEIITSDGDTSILNENLLDSAIAAAEASFDGKDFFPSPEQKIARVAYGIIKNHPFVDGNKRTGIMFLVISFDREKIPCKFSHEDLISFGQSIADGTLSQEDFILAVMQSCRESTAEESYSENRNSVERWQKEVDSELKNFGRISGRLYNDLDEAGFYLDREMRVKSKTNAYEAIIDRNSAKKHRKVTSFEDICERPEEICVIPGAGGDLADWKDGICRMCDFQKRPEFITFNGDQLNTRFGLKGNNAYAKDYMFIAFPVEDYMKSALKKNFNLLGAKYMIDLVK